MIQFSRRAEGARECGPGHRPQIVETRGAPPRGHRLGEPVPPQWHVECAICQVATQPAPTADAALARWRGRRDLFHSSLSELSAVRGRVLVAAR